MKNGSKKVKRGSNQLVEEIKRCCKWSQREFRQHKRHLTTKIEDLNILDLTPMWIKRWEIKGPKPLLKMVSKFSLIWSKLSARETRRLKVHVSMMAKKLQKNFSKIWVKKLFCSKISFDPKISKFRISIFGHFWAKKLLNQRFE